MISLPEAIMALVALGWAVLEHLKARHAKADAKLTRERMAAVIDGVDALDGEQAEQAKEKIQEKAEERGLEDGLNREIKTRRLERRRETPQGDA